MQPDPERARLYVNAAKPENGPLAVASLLLAATLWGLLWYPLRLLEGAGLSGLWATLVIYASAALVVLPVLRRPPRLAGQRLDLLWMCLAAGWTNVAYILAVIEGNVVRVMLLFFLSPLWTLLLGYWLLGERLTVLARRVFVLAFAGALVMLWDPDIGLPWPRGRADWLAVSSGMAFALTNVMVRRLHGVALWWKTWASWLGVMAVAGVALLLTGSVTPPAAPVMAWGGAVALGMFGMVLMTVSVQYGVTHMPVHRSAVILLFELVAGALSAALLTDETVRPNEWAGGLMIVTAAWLAARLPQAGPA